MHVILMFETIKDSIYTHMNAIKTDFKINNFFHFNTN